MKILSWNLGVGSRGDSWRRKDFKEIIKTEIADIFFFQEVPAYKKTGMVDIYGFINRTYWKDFYVFTSSRMGQDGKTFSYLMVTLVKKELFPSGYQYSSWIPAYEVRLDNYHPFALAVHDNINKRVYVNCHLKTCFLDEDSNQDSFAIKINTRQFECLKSQLDFLSEQKCSFIVAGDYNSKYRGLGCCPDNEHFTYSVYRSTSPDQCQHAHKQKLDKISCSWADNTFSIIQHVQDNKRFCESARKDPKTNNQYFPHKHYPILMEVALPRSC